MTIERLEKRLIKKGLERGVPPEILFHAVRTRRILASPMDWLSRRNKALALRRVSPWASFIDPVKGYRVLGPGDLPGMDEAISAARQIYESKKLDPTHSKKPFFSNILEERDLRQFPEVLAFARSTPLIESAACYLGTLPEILVLGVFVSPPSTGLAKSQLYHIDDEDVRLVKCFIYIYDVTPENGPLTFIPADKSEAIRRKINHRWRGRRLNDDEIVPLCEPGDIVAPTGPAGTGVLVDTSRCLHFGSRCIRGVRAAIMISYARQPNIMFRDQNESRSGMSLMLSRAH